MLKEFKTFIARGNVVDLAVGIIMGAAFTAIVNSLVSDIIMPPIGRLMGNLDFSNYFLDLTGRDYPNLKAAQDAGAATVNYGLFINQVIKFIIVSAAVFFLVRAINRLQIVEAAKPAAPTLSEQLLAEIRDLLKNR